MPLELRVVNGLVASVVHGRCNGGRPGAYPTELAIGCKAALPAAAVGFLRQEHTARLIAASKFNLTFALFNRFAEFFGLECKHLGLRGAGLALLLKLAAESFELPRLDLEELGLLAGELLLVGHLALNGADFLGLLPEGQVRGSSKSRVVFSLVRGMRGQGIGVRDVW